jgi:hypothetical protein
MHDGRLLDVGTRDEILDRYPRQLIEVRTSDRFAVRERLAAVTDVDDVSLFGTVLHVRGRAGVNGSLMHDVRRSLDGIVAADAINRVRPSLEDVFVLHGEEGES